MSVQTFQHPIFGVCLGSSRDIDFGLDASGWLSHPGFIHAESFCLPYMYGLLLGTGKGLCLNFSSSEHSNYKQTVRLDGQSVCLPVFLHRGLSGELENACLIIMQVLSD